MRILSLYSIDDIPAVEDIVYTSLQIVFVPQASVILRGVEQVINIDFVPQPSVSLIIPATITMVPQPSVNLTGMAALITYVHQPSVQLILPIEIVHIPQLSVTLEGVIQNIEIFSIPQPSVSFKLNIASNIAYIPQPSVHMEGAGLDPVGDEYFWGFTPYGNSLTRDSYVSYMMTAGMIDTMLAATNYSGTGYLQKNSLASVTSDGIPMTNWERNIPIGETAYMVFLIPTSWNEARSWANNLGQGQIGGTPNESTTGNHWPDFEHIITYNGKPYYLYVGNRRRRNSGTTNIFVQQ